MALETEAAQAPTVEEAVVSSEPVVTQEPEVTEDSLMDEIYDRLTGDDGESDDDAPKEAAEGTPDGEDVAPADEAPVEVEELPHDLPVRLKEHWAGMTEEARESITSAHRDMAQKVAAATRESTGLKPIRTALEESIKANPAIANMKPEEMAEQLPGLVEAGQMLKRNPVGAIMHLMNQHGITQHVAQALGAQGGTPAMLQELANIKQENEALRKQFNPDALEEQFNGWQSKNQTMTAVQEFAAQADHWSDVEPHLAPFIDAVQQTAPPGTSPEDVLSGAYEMAVARLFPDKAKAKESAPEADSAQDPAKVESVKRATSVNVQSRASGKPKPQTQDQLDDAIWAKHHQA